MTSNPWRTRTTTEGEPTPSTKTRIAAMATGIPIALSLASLAGAVSLSGKEGMLKRSGFHINQAGTPATLPAFKQLHPLHNFQRTATGRGAVVLRHACP